MTTATDGRDGATGQSWQTTHRLIEGDARFLHQLVDKTVDLVVTSPPYPLIEIWDTAFAAMAPEVSADLRRGDGWHAFQRMHDQLELVWRALMEVLRPGGYLCINIGDATRTVAGAFQLYPNHAEALRRCVRIGMQNLPAILWRKSTNAPTKFMGSGMLPGGAHATLEHEFILLLRKPGKRQWGPDQRERRRRSAYFWEERNRWFSDLWAITGTRQKRADLARRTAAFPLEIPRRLIQMFSVQGDLVLDPFAGTGTTAVAALESGRHSVGIDNDATLLALARGRVGAAVPSASTWSQTRLAAHRDFVVARTAAGKPPAYYAPGVAASVVTRQERDLVLPAVTGGRVSDGLLVADHAPLAPEALQGVLGLEPPGHFPRRA